MQSVSTDVGPRFVDNQGNDINFVGSELGKWHAMELMVKLNNGAQLDGEVAMWVDGIRRTHHTGVQLRCPEDTTGINDVWTRKGASRN